MGIFDDNSNHTCNMPSHFVADAPNPVVGNWSFHKLNMAISWSCAAFSSLSIFILMLRHATHFSKPNEQSKILKICALVPIYSILSFLSIAFPNSYIYLDPWIDFFQGIALGSFFLLLCEFVSPSSSSRDVFFAAMEVPKSHMSRGKSQPPVDGLEWYRKQWFAVFQYPVIALGVSVATDITQAAKVYCLESSSIHYSHLWLEIVSNISISFAITSVVRFYGALRKDLGHHKPLAKFLAFKLIIFLTFLQGIIFWILRSTHALKETNTLTWADVNFGIQTMIVCIEMVPFSIFFHWAYDVGAYDLSKARPLPLAHMGASGTNSPHDPENGYHRVDQYQMEQQKLQQDYYNHPAANGGAYYGGVLGIKALMTVVNPMEILRAIQFGFSMRSESRRMNRNVAVGPPAY